ncbi:hypothetical protein [Nonomuraea jabiensis]|uniref:Secreted protein n=1 Tax=Nonomuraea jabiensis TaxID=882448 RepID=A0A7W9GDG7_9ACTN|nr:hypothetical protein [Nonomuraea jabiensis]MBB5781787.1 hypothetical protein [Nonomuraea jabiensis]
MSGLFRGTNGRRIVAVLFGAVAAAVIGATAATPAQAAPPWWSYGDDAGDAGLYQVHYEDGRPFTVELCWTYEWGQVPCGRYF